MPSQHATRTASTMSQSLMSSEDHSSHNPYDVGTSGETMELSRQLRLRGLLDSQRSLNSQSSQQSSAASSLKCARGNKWKAAVYKFEDND